MCRTAQTGRRRAVRMSRERPDVKHVIYEDPITHKFALIRLPDKFVTGDKLPIPPTDRWFRTREEAVAALPELLDQEE
jgi:hypothetical protein